MRKILVTNALTYANGPMHLGHIVEYIQTDIWVRLQKLLGNDCIYICGDDAHGTPIMLSAEKQGINPEQLIADMKLSHEQDLADFYIDLDNFYTTHSEENQNLVGTIYKKLCDNDDIEKRIIKQAYDAEKNMFLPDRFIKGECPRCGAKDQYGDNCEVCGATYSPLDLKDPLSVISGTVPIEKESLHYFFRLEKYTDMLKKWMQDSVQPEIAHKLNEWFAQGLKQWDISRDAPYFGFPIPNEKDKYFYVWLDAPVGYMASFKNLCAKRSDLDFNAYWELDSNVELYHFVGKDIIYFHALFWPAVLTGAGLRKPNKIFTHGFLTINGQKMSKSRGTFILARDYLKQLNPEYLRYYFAAKIGPGIDDIDLNFEDFERRVNSDLVGKVVNIASRCAGFINKKFNNQLANTLIDTNLLEDFITAYDEIAKLYEDLEYNHAVREIMALADKANQYIDEKKPWILAKQSGQESQVQDICSMGINLFRILIIYLKPILPKMAKDAEEFLNIAPLIWHDVKMPLLGHRINEFKSLMQRVDKDKIMAIIT
jgi:methionyl-tRNA synthetase